MISRSGPTPYFYEYICRRALVSPQGNIPPAVDTLNPTLLRVPAFQRGISWDKQQVMDFLNSDSVLFGTVIIGNFNQQPGELIDGLQRFAVGTALLHTLYSLVLSPTPSDQTAAVYFQRLRSFVSGLQVVIDNNHYQLWNHPRRAISEQYQRLDADIQKLCAEELQPAKALPFAQLLEHTFLDKQIAIDEYFNFQTPLQLVNTFIGINTVRVDLGPVDLIRAYIVEKASSIGDPWTTPLIAEMENRITEVFTDNENPKQHFIPLATVFVKCLEERDGLVPTRVFPNWNALQPQDVDNLLDYLADIELCNNPYLTEIRASGNLPFGVAVLHYYAKYLSTGHPPACLNNGDNVELHDFLRATYRVLIGAEVGQLGPVAIDAIKNTYPTLSDAAHAVGLKSGSPIRPRIPRINVTAGKNWQHAPRARAIF